MKNNLIILMLVLLVVAPFLSAVTPDGSAPAGDNMNIFITFLFIFTTLGLFYSLFMSIAKFAMLDEGLLDVLVSWSFFIMLLIVNHLTAHYVEDVFMYDLTEGFITLTPYSNVILPLIAFVVTILVKGFQKKRPVHVGEY